MKCHSSLKGRAGYVVMRLILMPDRFTGGGTHTVHFLINTGKQDATTLTKKKIQKVDRNQSCHTS